ncbi:hypothetical protein ACF0H5_000850 [Mactra antiquata]
MIEFGIIFAFGSMFIAMIETFKANRSTAATVQSLLIGVALSFSIVSGCLISRFGLLKTSFVASIIIPAGFIISFFIKKIEYLYITISVVAGVGMSTIHLASIIVIEQFFPTRLHPLCFAIQGITVNIAGALYPELIENLLSQFGLHGTFLILGGLFLNGVVVPLLLMNRRAPNTCVMETKVDIESDYADERQKLTMDDKHDSVSDATAENEDDGTCFGRCTILSIPFLTIVFASAFSVPPINTFVGLVVDLIVWKNFSFSQGVFAFIPFNAFSIAAKLVPIFTQRIKGFNNYILIMVFCVIGIIGQILILLSKSYVSVIAGVSCAGICLGGVLPTILMVCVTLVDSNSWPLASGLIIAVIGLMSAVMGPIFGSIRDLTGSYEIVVIIILTTECFAILIFCVAFIISHQARNQLTDHKNRNMCHYASR